MENMVDSAPKSDDRCIVDHILELVKRIIEDNAYIEIALEQLEDMPDNCEKTEIIGDIVHCRETTNQQALRVCEKIYDDLKLS